MQFLDVIELTVLDKNTEKQSVHRKRPGMRSRDGDEDSAPRAGTTGYVDMHVFVCLSLELESVTSTNPLV